MVDYNDMINVFSHIEILQSSPYYWLQTSRLTKDMNLLTLLNTILMSRIVHDWLVLGSLYLTSVHTEYIHVCRPD